MLLFLAVLFAAGEANTDLQLGLIDGDGNVGGRIGELYHRRVDTALVGEAHHS